MSEMFAMSEMFVMFEMFEPCSTFEMFEMSATFEVLFYVVRCITTQNVWQRCLPRLLQVLQYPRTSSPTHLSVLDFHPVQALDLPTNSLHSHFLPFSEALDHNTSSQRPAPRFLYASSVHLAPSVRPTPHPHPPLTHTSPHTTPHTTSRDGLFHSVDTLYFCPLSRR